MQRIAFRHQLVRHKLSTLALAVGLFAGGSGTAWAQDESAAPAASAKSDDIIVTGSRVSRSTFDTPNPVTVIDSKDIANLGLTNVGEVVAQMPSNSNFFAANNVGLGNFNVGAQLVNLRGLNPFFGTRTLTLVDTHRVVSTTTGGGVDITLIPSMLVERTETVTGGASAVYGSDAVAGVVNIILDKKYEGFKAQADFGGTTHGDGKEYHLSGAWGSSFADGRGHIVIGGEYQRSDAIGVCTEARDWCGDRNAFYTNPDYATNGQPHYIIGPNAYAVNTSSTGVLVPCAMYAGGACFNIPALGGDLVQFTPDGTGVVPYDRGKYSAGGSFFGFQQGGDQYAVGAYSGTTMRPQVDRYTTLAHLTYDVTDSLTAFVEGSYAHSKAINSIANGAIGPYALEIFDRGYIGNRVFADNAFLPADVAAMIGPDGAMFSRDMLSEQAASNETKNSTWRILGGLNGNIGQSTWGWDLYLSHGVNKNDQYLHHNVVSTFLNYALDAVDDGSGNIVCGVNVPGRINPSTGIAYSANDVALANISGTCAPLNLFGIGNASQEAIDYAFRTLEEHSTMKQDVAALNLRGDLFDGFGAGSVKLATGVEYRRETVEVTHALDSQPYYSGYFLSYGLDFGGKTEVMEGYAELNVPVLKDSPVGKYLEIDGAVRATKNKNLGTLGANDGAKASHSFVSWKVSGIWDVTDWLRVRGTRSRDVRAAQFRELFQTYAPYDGPPYGVVSNPWSGVTSDGALVTSGGNVNLRPEKADTLTAGVVLTPQGGLNGFRFSADWYQIKIKDAIAGPPFGIGAQNIVTGCYQYENGGTGNGEFCDLIERTGTGPTTDIIAVNNTAYNLNSFVTRGVDFEAAYRTSLGGGSLNVRVLASYLYDMISNGTNYAGQSGPASAFGSFNPSPYWQGNAFVTYSKGPFTGTVQARYVGPGRYMTVTASGGAPIDPSDANYDPTDPNSISDNSVDSAIYINLNASFDITENVQLFGSLNNAFDKDPAVAPGGNGFPTNPVYFDTYGRTFKVGARVKF